MCSIIINIPDHALHTCQRFCKQRNTNRQTILYVYDKNTLEIVDEFVFSMLNTLETEYLWFGAILIRPGHEQIETCNSRKKKFNFGNIKLTLGHTAV